MSWAFFARASERRNCTTYKFHVFSVLFLKKWIELKREKTYSSSRRGWPLINFSLGASVFLCSTFHKRSCCCCFYLFNTRWTWTLLAPRKCSSIFNKMALFVVVFQSIMDVCVFFSKGNHPKALMNSKHACPLSRNPIKCIIRTVGPSSNQSH